MTNSIVSEIIRLQDIEKQKYAEAETFRKLAAFHQQQYLTAMEDYAKALGEFANKMIGDTDDKVS